MQVGEVVGVVHRRLVPRRDVGEGLGVQPVEAREQIQIDRRQRVAFRVVQVGDGLHPAAGVEVDLQRPARRRRDERRPVLVLGDDADAGPAFGVEDVGVQVAAGPPAMARRRLNMRAVRGVVNG